MNRYEVVIEDTGERYPCKDGDSVLRGMEALGRKGIPVGCRGGGCGVCKVEIVAGDYYVSRVMSREHVSEDDERCHRVLACRVNPLTDLRLKVLGPIRKNLCRQA